MKCAVCNYEKLGNGISEVPDEYGSSYGDRDPEKEPFKKIMPDIGYYYEEDRWGTMSKTNIGLYACPKCETIRIKE
jgi:hypothetical protein